MIRIDQIRNYFPSNLKGSPTFDKFLLKEYLQLMILDFLSTTHYIRNITLIGGTNLRLVKGIDRFSEDLDFDCKSLSEEDFIKMSYCILQFLLRNGINAEIRDKKSTKLTAFRSNIHFPELLFELGLTGHKEERLLIKIESQDQKIDYITKMVDIKGCGMYFSFPVPPDGVLCSMKLSALLSRAKGRDFYDSMFLLSQTKPDYDFLVAKQGIHNQEELLIAIKELLEKVDLIKKNKDCEHLLFNKSNSEKILRFGDFIGNL